MQLRKLPKIAVALLGSVFALLGAINLWISFIGAFTTGRSATAVAGAIFLIFALASFAYIFSRKLSKILVSIGLLTFAGAMLWLVFSMSQPAANHPTYQVAAIALAVLLLARVVSGLRPKSIESGT